MNSQNTFLISMPLFGVATDESGKKLLHHMSIINYGKELPDGQIQMITKAGKEIRDKSSFVGPIQLYKMENISLDHLMRDWKRANNEYSKPIILDETIETFEIWENKYSPMNIMVDRRSDCIAIKPIFETVD